MFSVLICAALSNQPETIPETVPEPKIIQVKKKRKILWTPYL
jgi:hypothetical protein